MNYVLQSLGLRLFIGAWIFAGILAVFPPSARADWADSSDPLAVQVEPTLNARVRQNPPGFAWSRYEGNEAGYEVQVRNAGGRTYHWKTGRNWYLPAAPLPVGTYTWRVRGLGRDAPWSGERRFSIPADATPFIIPTDDQLIAGLKKKGHPRSFSFEGTDEKTWRKRVLAARAPGVRQLEDQVQRMIATPPLRGEQIIFVPKERNPAAWAESIAAIDRQVESECLQLRRAALLWRLTADADMLTEARRRGDAIAAYDPRGATSPRNQDQASRNIAWSLALALDYLGGDAPAEERAAWLSSIEVRTQAIYDDLFKQGERLAQRPFDSHGSTTFGYLAAIATLLVGDIPQAETWFRGAFRAYAQYINPWGGEEGGYGNGTAYAEYNVDSTIQLWDRIWAATGVNLYTKPWSRGMLRFFVDFVPPGATTHEFGDAAETRPALHQLKAYASRFSDPLAAWYMTHLDARENPYTLLGAPLPLPAERVRPAPPRDNAAYYPSIGWTAMHSGLADPHRTSLYFKSSRFGAFNHSHGDQNSFVLTVDGAPVLLDTGYYDWYGSPHWRKWYRQTEAHNAITFDGGKGQAVGGYEENMRANGSIVSFRSSPLIDAVTGDATAAYGGVLSAAMRRVWYLRDLNVVVVWDKLAAPEPHVFEWNVHTPARIEQKDAGEFLLRQDRGDVCIRTLLPAAVRFEQFSGYPVPPQVDTPAPVWHGRMSTPDAQKEAEFLQVISIGCGNGAEPVRPQLRQGKLKVGRHVLDLS